MAYGHPAGEGGAMQRYHVVRDSTLDGLVKRVNELAVRGWEPAGGVCVDAGYIQALFLPLPKPSPVKSLPHRDPGRSYYSG